MSNQTISPCPFHTFESIVAAKRTKYLYAVCCSLCDAHGPLGVTKSIAVEMWNTRAGSEYQAEIDALRAELEAFRKVGDNATS